MLLVLGEDAARNACTDYFVAQGCEVDVAADHQEAQGMLRFRDYDLLLADLPREGEPRIETLRTTALARLRKASTVRVLLSGADEKAGDDGVIVLPMPQPLGAILELATGATGSQPVDRRFRRAESPSLQADLRGCDGGSR